MRGICVALLVGAWSLDATAAPTVITMNPNPLDAGNVLLGGSGSASGTLSSNNNVHVNLSVTTNCSGDGRGTFTLSPDANVNLNSPATIMLTYTPSMPGSRVCQVAVHDAGGAHPLLGTFNVRGDGKAPASITVTGTTTFGSLRWNDAAPNHTFSRTFTVTNGGDVTLDVSNVQIGGTNAGDFAITSGGTAQQILPGNSKSWMVEFDPSAGGARTATLTFTSNDPDDPTHTLTLTGTGTNAVISVPATEDFGIVVSGTKGAIDVPISNIGGAPKGNLGVTSATITDTSGWFTFNGCGNGTTCTFTLPLSIANSDTISVACSPPAEAAANMMQTATLSIVSDTDNAASNPANTVALTCTAGKSDMTLQNNTVQFTPTLVATTSTMSTVNVTNNGNVGATFYLEVTGSDAGAFAVTTSTGCGTMASQCSLPPAGTVTINVTFTPSDEGDSAANLRLVASVGASPQIALTGRGIDRHIELVGSVQFPDTFRNPGEMATVLPVTVKNIGEYPLHVSSVQLDGAPNWELAASFEPFDVPGLSSVDVDVKFTPVSAGKAPDGILAVMSDDRTNNLLNVVISGNGKDRNVSMGPSVDFGNTGAGVPVTLTSLKTSDQWLRIANLDEADFKIREITFDMPDVFHIERLSGDSVANMDLPIGANEPFEIVFSPPDVGEYVATMNLYLDEDPLVARSIEVRGRALFVDAHGGGGFGCSAGHGTGGGMALVLLALLRRKRRRA